MITNHFETIAARHRDRAAVSCGGHTLTYGALATAVNGLAQRVRAHFADGHADARGAEQTVGETVGLFLDKDIEGIIALWAVLKAGKIYVPLDVHAPPERLIDAVHRFDISLVLTAAPYAKIAGQASETTRVIDIGNPLTTTTDPADPADHRETGGIDCGGIDGPAYILQTSGSGGTPKGVVQTRENLLFFSDAYSRALSVSHCDRVSFISSFAFDGAVEDIFPALLNGACLCPVSIKDRPMADVARWLAREQITLYHSVPTVFRYLVSSLAEGETFPHVRVVCMGAESLRSHDVDRIKRHFPGARLAHMYGQTESSVNTMYLLDPRDHHDRDGETLLPIGEPLGGIELILFNEAGEEVETFETGEIYVASKHIAAGYWKNPDATAEVFLRDPDLGPLYRTGDLGEIHDDGLIRILGRKDHQVKIRGYRVEPGEIENRLLDHDQVGDAVVIALDDADGDEKGDEKYLCAYVVNAADPACVDSACLDPDFLRDYLAARLPDYMVPSRFMVLETLPRTANGKIDRRALPLPPRDRGNRGVNDGPRDRLEKKLAETWGEVLGVDPAAIGMGEDFFRLGGHSLKATLLISVIHRELGVLVPLGEFFNHPTVRGLADYIRGAGKSPYTPLLPAEKRDYYPLSSAQERLYFLNRMYPDSIAYNMPLAVPLSGAHSPGDIRAVVGRLAARHESLRTSFHMVDDRPVQRVHRRAEPELETLDGDVGGDVGVNLLMQFVRPFDLSRAPLMRVALGGGGAGGVLMVDMHHIVSDGSSHGILAREFLALLKDEELGELTLHYKDFCLWRGRMRERDEMKQQRDYWLNEFADAAEIPRLNVPADFVRPAAFSFAGAGYRFRVDGADAAGFNALGAETGATPYMNFLALLNTLFYRCSGQTDIITGCLVAGRPHAQLRDIIGMFVNTLPMRCRPRGEKTYRLFLEEVKAGSIRAFENQDFQFEELVDALELSRDLSRNPLFDISMVVQNFRQDFDAFMTGPVPPDTAGGAHIAERTAAKFDMTFLVQEVDGGIDVTIEYYTGVFKAETIAALASRLVAVLRAVTANPALPLKDIDILSPDEKRRVLFDFNTTDADYPLGETMDRLFTARARREPDRAALVQHRRNLQLTHGGLDGCSDRLAAYLVARGVGVDTVVALMVPRSVEMMVGVFAILKAGGAYLPIDPAYPRDRVAYLVRDSGAALLLTEAEMDTAATGPPSPENSSHESFHTSFRASLDSGRSAYVIYTSGSTGRPKGVMIDHYSLVNRLNWMQKRYRLSGADTLLQKTPFTFDVSVWELFWWSFTGARLCLPDPGAEKNPEKIIHIVERHRVTLMHFVPSMLGVFLDYVQTGGMVKRLAPLRQFIASGEALTVAHVRAFHRLFSSSIVSMPRLDNLYGPTEATIDVTAFACSDPAPDKIPIGKPIDNTWIYILDIHYCPLPPGIGGELHIGGTGVGRGYLNRPETTAERFLTILPTLPASPNKKFFRGSRGAVFQKSPPGRRRHSCYRTGDLARWLLDGNIEYLGRSDFQVKVRGFRIETGEIENRLKTGSGVKDALVMARADGAGENYLCAYVVGSSVEEVVLRDYLALSLPLYMVPDAFVFLDRFPLTANGKIHRGALPDPRGEGVGDGHREPPADEVEEAVLQSWADILGIPPGRIGVLDNFFQLGGNSVSILRLYNRLTRQFGPRLAMGDLFRRPTVRGLASSIRAVARSGESENMVPLNSGPVEKSLFIFHPMHGMLYQYMELAQLLEDSCRVVGIQAAGVTDEGEGETPLPGSFRDMVEQYAGAIKGVQPDGPYLLAGYCIGAKLAYEVARLLEEGGGRVERLIMLDAYAFIPELVFKGAPFRRWWFRLGNRLSTYWEARKGKKGDGLESGLDGGLEQGPVHGLNRRVEANNIRLNDGYRYGGMVGCPVTVIRAVGAQIPLMTARDWSKMTTGPVRFLETSGDHETLLASPHVGGLATLIKEDLRSVPKLESNGVHKS